MSSCEVRAASTLRAASAGLSARTEAIGGPSCGRWLWARCPAQRRGRCAPPGAPIPIVSERSRAGWCSPAGWSQRHRASPGRRWRCSGTAGRVLQVGLLIRTTARSGTPSSLPLAVVLVAPVLPVVAADWTRSRCPRDWRGSSRRPPGSSLPCAPARSSIAAWPKGDGDILSPIPRKPDSDHDRVDLAFLIEQNIVDVADLLVVGPIERRCPSVSIRPRIMPGDICATNFRPRLPTTRIHWGRCRRSLCQRGARHQSGRRQAGAAEGSSACLPPFQGVASVGRLIEERRSLHGVRWG